MAVSRLTHTRSNGLVIAALLIAALSSCAKNTKHNVDMNMILPPSAEHMKLPEDQTFLMPSPISEQMPDYPSELVSRSLGDITACAEIVIEHSGLVSSVTPLYEIPDCPLSKQEIDARFSSAVTEALLTWTFTHPATCSFAAGVEKTDDCSGPGVIITPVAIKLAFVFTFQVSNGRTMVKKKRT